jgi:23S rRNA pseudouridine1911/1915/1917 synthase
MRLKIPQILFQDDNFIVINKPAGMIVNKADTAKNEFTVQDWIQKNSQFSNLNSQVDSEFSKRGGIVHRLDKDTSGVLLVALNEKSFSDLQKQFKERTVKKEYIALVHGKLVSEGEINVPIGRLPWNRMRFGVIPQGRESYTKFKTVAHKKLIDYKTIQELSLVEVYPQTGRTHQIRVHMQYAGNPIFADSLYAGRKTFAHDRKYLSRHFLHASKISFISPTNGKKITFSAPLTAELVDFLGQLT